MIDAAISRRWAKALIELAAEAGKVEVIAKQIMELAVAVRGSDELAELMRNPALEARRAPVFTQLLAASDADELLRRFVAHLIVKGRLPALPAIADATERAADEHLGQTRGEVVSASSLSQAELASLTSTLSASIGKKVILEASVDERLIIGLRVQLGSKLIDHSVAGRLERIGRALSV